MDGLSTLLGGLSLEQPGGPPVAERVEEYLRTNATSPRIAQLLRNITKLKATVALTEGMRVYVWDTSNVPAGQRRDVMTLVMATTFPDEQDTFNVYQCWVRRAYELVGNERRELARALNVLKAE